MIKTIFIKRKIIGNNAFYTIADYLVSCTMLFLCAVKI